MKLTDNFDTTTDTKIFGGNTPTEQHISNAKKLAENLQVIRDHVGKPITVTSGLRSVVKNSNTPGASKVSQHLHGEAWDVVFDGMYDVFDQLMRGEITLPHKCSQIIKEAKLTGEKWLHIAIITDRWLEVNPHRNHTEFKVTKDTINYTTLAVK